MADSYAARLLRKQARHHSRLGEFRLILSDRAYRGLKSCKDQPAGTQTCLDYFLAEDIIEDRVEYPRIFQENQKFFNSGHLAFMWASRKWPKSEFHMFGFDSIFTGEHRLTYSNVDVREYSSYTPEREVLEEMRPSTENWINNWNVLFDMERDNYSKVVFHGYEGDKDLPFTGDIEVYAHLHSR